jgi:hypothetical protein
MSMFRAFAVASVAAALATPVAIFASSPAAAKSVVKMQDMKPTEAIGPAAAGKPKTYSSQVPVVCDAGVCTAKFGKKNGKVRTIETLGCVMYSNGKNLLGAVALNEEQEAFRLFMAPLSNEEVNGLSYSIFNWTVPFEVPSNAPFNVLLQTSGDQAFAVCTVYGSIQ